MRFNPPPGWPQPPAGWVPPPDWKPDPAWPPMPEDWQLWLPHDDTPTPPPPSAPDPLVTEIPVQASVAVPQNEPSMPAPVAQAPVPVAPTPAAPPAAPAADTSALRRRIADLEAALTQTGGGDVIELNDQRVLQDVGIYRYHHPLEDAAAYKDWLADINGRIDDVVKANRAVLAADLFTLDGSLAKGRKMVGDLSKLMLRAYNAEADNCVRSIRNGNISTAKKRLENAMESIEKLGVIMEMRGQPRLPPAAGRRARTHCGLPDEGPGGEGEGTRGARTSP